MGNIGRTVFGLDQKRKEVGKRKGFYRRRFWNGKWRIGWVIRGNFGGISTDTGQDRFIDMLGRAVLQFS